MADNFQNLSGNDFYPIRAQNIFDPQNFGVNMPSAPQQEPDMLDLISKLYQPSNDLSDQFKQALSQMPQREHPGKLRQVGAALAGMSTFGPAHFYGGVPVGFSANPIEGEKISDQFLNAPYYKKLEDWKLKTGMLEKGASEEQKQNVNKRLLAEQTAGRIIQQKGLTEKTRHELETEQFNRQKSEQIYEVKLADMQRKVDDADQKLNFAMQESQRKQGNTEAELKLKQAQLDAINARHQLDVAQKDRALEEQKRLHDTMKEKWDNETKDREAKIKQYEEALGLKKQPTTTTTETKDATGKVTGSKVTTKTTPNAANLVQDSGPKIGDVKTFPNGNKGKWDGKGWIQVK